MSIVKLFSIELKKIILKTLNYSNSLPKLNNIINYYKQLIIAVVPDANAASPARMYSAANAAAMVVAPPGYGNTYTYSYKSTCCKVVVFHDPNTWNKSLIYKFYFISQNVSLWNNKNQKSGNQPNFPSPHHHPTRRTTK